MCDAVCQVQADRLLFAKSSDRPAAEPQVVEWHPGRPPGTTVATQYLDIGDEGALPLLGSRPSWLWGLEHGVNAAGVAIGNEKVWTTRDADARTPGLIGMDLVRLGLERARRADEAVEVIVELLERHGQGGVADAIDDEAYYSSFLVVDGRGGWVLDTVGRTWAAKPVDGGAAISNRLSLTTDWTRGSADLAPGQDLDELRDPAWGVVADVRLACTRPAVEAEAALEPAELAGLLRHHGTGPWGAPGVGSPTTIEALPGPDVGPDGSGITVCMHLRGYQATAASMVCELPGTPDPDASDLPPVRAWVALGSPCASVYVPTWVADGVPAALGQVRTWHRFAALRTRVEVPGAAGAMALGEVREVLGPLEAELWQEADALHHDGATADPEVRRSFAADAWARLDHALDVLGSPDVGAAPEGRAPSTPSAPLARPAPGTADDHPTGDHAAGGAPRGGPTAGEPTGSSAAEGPVAPGPASTGTGAPARRGSASTDHEGPTRGPSPAGCAPASVVHGIHSLTGIFRSRHALRRGDGPGGARRAAAP